jgi:geranylgeranyl diphosphate synthase type II
MKGTKRFDLDSYLGEKRQVINSALDRYLPEEDRYPQVLHKAMRYSVFSGGKRFRPILCVASFEASGGEGESILPVACAIEFIHTYSLIHDDLPCMDDDDLRRGKPTSHKVFGEAVAVLAGDALLSFAVELVLGEGARMSSLECTVRALRDIVRAAGLDGMVAGQVVDMESQGKQADERTLHYIHAKKSGALIASSARCGGIMAGADDEAVARLSDFGEKVGLAFQIVDDILDAEGRFGALKSGSELDRRKDKVTYPGVFGLARSKQITRDLISGAKDCVADTGVRGLPLMSLADLVINRSS